MAASQRRRLYLPAMLERNAKCVFFADAAALGEGAGRMERPGMRRVVILTLVNLALFPGVGAMAAQDSPAPVAENADVIEALFLGSGPLAPADGSHPCPLTDYWKGFPRGTTVKVRVSTTVSEKVREEIEEALRQVPEATNGAMEATFELTEDANPMPERNQCTLTFNTAPAARG